MKRFLLETATLVVAAILCATVANLVASRERNVQFVGNYPNALTVPQSQAEPAPPLNQAALQPLVEPAGPRTESAAAAAPSTATTEATPAPAAPTAEAKPPATAAAPAPTPEQKAAAPQQSPKVRFPPRQDVPYVEISSQDAEWLHGKGVLFLDARRTRDYEQGHIAGARPFSVWESDIDQKVEALFNEGRDQEAPIVVYCSGGDCEDSHMLSQKLWGLFFNNVLVYKDGFPAWVSRGNPVGKGSAS